MEIKKFGAIDLGSNSVRLLISNVLVNSEAPFFKRSSLIRVPVRLGVTAFTNHEIPEVAIMHLEETMLAFKHLMLANDVIHYKGCATSAMREAVNGKAIVKRIKNNTGINIEIISGNAEAELIFNSQNALAEKMESNCLFVDVGGGSTEITLFSQGIPIDKKSFSLGTLRILQNQIDKNDWKKMKEWVKNKAGDLQDFKIVGSGGNINSFSKLAGLKPGKALSYNKLSEMIEDLKAHTFEERMKEYDLNPDRADVIVPAGEIFVRIMKWVDADEIFIPKIGLGDGIAREAYKEYLNGKKSNLR
ncbi:MAG: exopolyphosphatase [Bacteroidota bacterium]